MKWHIVAILPGSGASVLGRISSAVLLAKIFAPIRWFRWHLFASSALLAISFSLFHILFYCSFSPATALWEPTEPHTTNIPPMVSAVVSDIMSGKQPSSLFSDPRYSLLRSSFVIVALILVDFTYIGIPLFILWRLQLSIVRHIGLLIVTFFSLIIIVASVLRFVAVINASPNNVPSQTPYIYITLEQALGIILGSCPALLSLFNQNWPVIQTIREWTVRVLSWIGTKSTSNSNASGPGGQGVGLDQLNTIGSSRKKRYQRQNRTDRNSQR